MSGFAARLPGQLDHLPPNFLGEYSLPWGRPTGWDGDQLLWTPTSQAVAIDSGHDRGRRVSGLSKGSAADNHRFQVVIVHVPNDVLNIVRDGIKCGTKPVGDLDPRHPAVAADVT